MNTKPCQARIDSSRMATGMAAVFQQEAALKVRSPAVEFELRFIFFPDV
jgi:hypothetical protein